MTYRQLGEIIKKFSKTELEQDATIYLTGIVESYPIERVTSIKPYNEIANFSNTGHMVLEVRDGN